jgi:dihydrolipoamide dehydrogenase
MPSYDVAVLGAGPAGYTAAIRAAERGAKTCIIESGHVGGCCLNVGCIPTKAMLHASEVYRHIVRASEYGFAAGQPSVDGAAFMGRVAQVVTGLRKGVEKLLKFRKIEVIRGRGRLTARDTIHVEAEAGPQDVTAKAIILATGSRPSRPGFLPWDSGKVLTTDEATAAKDLPKSILIVGGGVIGCEFATAYAELGIPTTVVEMLDRLVANIDAEAAKAITQSLEQRGVKILVGSKITGMKASEAGVVAAIEGGQTVEAACALVATGRAPNTQDLGLEALGIEMAGKVIKVDDRCATSVPGVYAIGDIAETRQYAHLATRMGIVAAENATGHAARDSRTVLPVGIYTHPEIACVGLSEDEAAKSGAKVRVSRFFYQGSGMARAYGDAEGQVKLIAVEGTGEILGALVIGQHATDVVQEIALAMRHELTVDEIAETIHPHPTFVEGVLEAAEAWTGFPTHAAPTAPTGPKA